MIILIEGINRPNNRPVLFSSSSSLLEVLTLVRVSLVRVKSWRLCHISLLRIRENNNNLTNSVR